MGEVEAGTEHGAGRGRARLPTGYCVVARDMQAVRSDRRSRYLGGSPGMKGAPSRQWGKLRSVLAETVQ